MCNSHKKTCKIMIKMCNSHEKTCKWWEIMCNYMKNLKLWEIICNLHEKHCKIISFGLQIQRYLFFKGVKLVLL